MGSSENTLPGSGGPGVPSQAPAAEAVSTQVAYALPATVEAPAIARRYLDEHGRDLPPDMLADALVLVSELVTNAVRHGRPDITLALRFDPPSVGVSVSDEGDPMPDLPGDAPSERQGTGRGLMIVSALASSWGVETVDDAGKTVWFELRN